MRKFLALICMAAAITALGWKSLSAALAPAPAPPDVAAITVAEPPDLSGAPSFFRFSGRPIFGHPACGFNRGLRPPSCPA